VSLFVLGDFDQSNDGPDMARLQIELMREHQDTAFTKPAKREPKGSRELDESSTCVTPLERGGGQVLFRLPLGRGSWSGSVSSLLFFRALP